MSDNFNGFCGSLKNAHGDFEEVQIQVPWGHLSGKWWGSKVYQPIIAIHGWQDNAGSFDKLAPLLVDKGHSLFCLDLPGHGFSSHYPPGIPYYIWWDGIHLIRRIVKHFNWGNITIMGHSLGGGIAFLYAATFPDETAKIITIDITSPGLRSSRKMLNALGDCVDKLLKYETLTVDRQPCYPLKEMLDIVHQAHMGSLTKESSEIMLRRGVKPALHKKDDYVFTRDPRLKVAALGFISIDETLEFAQKITCEVLNIKGNPGMKWDHPELYDKVLDTIEEQAKKVERHIVEGTHHLHLNNAERIVDIVHKFLV